MPETESTRHAIIDAPPDSFISTGEQPSLIPEMTWPPEFSALDSGVILAAAILGFTAWFGIRALIPKAYSTLDRLRKEQRLAPVRFGGRVVANRHTVVDAMMGLIRATRLLLVLVAAYYVGVYAFDMVGADVRDLLRGLLTTGFLVYLALAVNRAYPALYRVVQRGADTRIPALQIRGWKLLSSSDAARAITGLLRLARLMYGFLAAHLILQHLFDVVEFTYAGFVESLVAGVFVVAFTTIVYLSVNRLFPFVYQRIDDWEIENIPRVRVFGWEILSAAQLADLIIIAVEGLRIAIGFLFFAWVSRYALGHVPYLERWDYSGVIASVLAGALITVLIVILIRALVMVFSSIRERIGAWRGTLIKSVKVKRAELISQERLVELLGGTVKALQAILLIALVYIWLTSVFSLFAFTEEWGDQLVGYVLTPVGAFASAVINYIPNLFTIIVIVVVARFAIKFVHWLFSEIERGNIPVPGFYAEWAKPTFNITRFLMIAFVAVVIFPYLPGSDSPAFAGISVFLGVLFSLGSASAIANIISGIVLTYMRAYKIGDRVKISDTVGDVTEKTLLVTRIRTIKNVDITVPNAMVLGSHITNYSSSADISGLILHTTVTIGYDVPWRKVHELLLEAARRTEGVCDDPEPFVLQTGLQDYYPAYELNVYTNVPNAMAQQYSELHQNIQDVFNEAGVEILSPAYSAVRDGNTVTTPPEYLPKTYEPPGFRIDKLTGFLAGKPRVNPPHGDG